MSKESKGFRVGDLFDIRPTKSYGLTNIRLFETKGNVPVVVNSSLNNVIGGYVNLQPLESLIATLQHQRVYFINLTIL